MTELQPSELPSFLRRYHWTGRMLGVLLRQQRGELTADVLLRLRRSVSDLGRRPPPLVLRLRFVGLEECRIQRRPGKASNSFERGKLAFLKGLYYASFDDWQLGAGEQPGVHDFRSSDLFFASARLLWAERSRRSS